MICCTTKRITLPGYWTRTECAPFVLRRYRLHDLSGFGPGRDYSRKSSAGKPVSRILFPRTRRSGNHSSSPGITAEVERPTRELPPVTGLAGRAPLLSYLVLLRVGFTLPPISLSERCALTLGRRSDPHLFTLTSPLSRRGDQETAVCFL